MLPIVALLSFVAVGGGALYLLATLPARLGHVLGTLARPSAQLESRVSALETDLAATRRQVNDIDESAERRYRRLTQRDRRASEEEPDALEPESISPAAGRLNLAPDRPAPSAAAGGTGRRRVIARR